MIHSLAKRFSMRVIIIEIIVSSILALGTWIYFALNGFL